MTLGGDIVGGQIGRGNFVLTRLHARYGKSDMKDDLRFREAKPVTGGREQWSKNGLEFGATPSPQNFFQARYAIRHAWTGPIKCQNPVRGRWGGRPGHDEDEIATQPALNLAFAPRGKVQLPSLVAQDVPEIDVKAGQPLPGGGGFQGKPQGCGCASGGLAGGGLAGGGALAGLVAILVRRRRRS